MGVAALCVAAALYPAVHMLASLHRLALNVMILDDFDLTQEILHNRVAPPVFGDLWALHNEHRMVIPKLVFAVVTRVRHFDEIALQYINFGLMAVAAGLLWATLRRVAGRTAWPLLFVACSAIIWSPLQYFNWLRGFEIQWSVLFLAATGAAFGLAVWPGTRKGLIAICAATVAASYSLANGLILWPAALAAMLFSRQWSGKQTCCLAAVGLASTIAFLIGWHPAHIEGDHALSYLPSLQFWLILIGMPFASEDGADPAQFAIAGLFVLSAFAIAVLSFSGRDRDDLRARLGAPLLLCVFAAVSAAVIMAGRMPLGMRAAHTSRYITGDMLFWIGLLLAAGAFAGHFETTRRPVRFAASWLVCAAIAIAMAASMPEAYRLGDKKMAVEHNWQAQLAYVSYNYPDESDDEIAVLAPDHAVRNDLVLLDRDGDGPFMDRALEASARHLFAERAALASGNRVSAAREHRASGAARRLLGER
ncbi:MAG: hypothetical protein P4L33_01585 [Capsulimonadaceae bacterium]|nr:hypothetical protein [Capsulimonadaceae bacterium]